MKRVIRAGLAIAVAAGMTVPATTLTARPDPGFEARDAYYSGEVERAYPMAIEVGEHWVAGLAAYRLEEYAAALDLFAEVANDATQDVWTRSGAAFWAARASVLAGAEESETAWLQQAAASPWTFYGMVAEAKLGLEPGASFHVTVLPPDIRLAEANDPMARLIRTSVEATQADALQAFATMAPIPEVDGFRPETYPAPDLAPQGGFTIDPALVYALVRQESRFNEAARSHVGARGLMQLMPATAAYIAGDPSLQRNRAQLNDGGLNLRLGQDYMHQLATELVGDDMFRVVAAYNGGPAAVARTIDRLPWGADPFLFIESLPAPETRDYVEKVMAGYWLYRRQFGQATPSLAALAGGEMRIPLDYDRSDNAAPRIQQVSMTEARF